MNLRKIKKEFKKYDGGVLKFQDKKSKKKFYFEMNFNQFKSVYKKLRLPWKNVFVVLSEDSQHFVYSNFNDLKVKYDIDYQDLGSLIKFQGKTYGICNRARILELLSHMVCPEKDRIDQGQGQKYHDFTNSVNETNEIPNKKKSPKVKELLPRWKPIKAKDFYWDEAYAEGLRIFDDDIEEAEAYADDQKFKVTGKY